MIIQCDKCLSKFKIDDAKVKPQGVKVKCKKCENIFTVFPEKPKEEVPTKLSDDIIKTPEEKFSETEFKGFDMPSFEASLEGKDKESEDVNISKTEAHVSAKESEKDEFSWDQFNIDFGEKKEDELPPAEKEGKKESVTDEFDFESFGAIKGDSASVNEEKKDNKDVGEFDINFGDINAAPSNPPIEEEKTTKDETSNIFDEFVFEEPAEHKESFVEEKKDEFVFDFEESKEEKKGEEIESRVEEPVTSESPTFDFSLELPPETLSEETLKTTEQEKISSLSEQGVEESSIVQEAIEESAEQRELGGFVFMPQDEKKEFTFEEKKEEVSTEEAITQQPPLEFEAVKPEKTWLTYLVAILVTVIISGTGIGLIWWQKTKLLETEGNFGVVGVKVDFYDSKTLEKVFVVKGNVVNGYKIPKSFIKIKATIKSKDNKLLATKIVFAGNIFSQSEINELTYSEIEKGLNNKMGKSMMNVDIPPGKSLPFMVVFDKIPAEAATVEVESL